MPLYYFVLKNGRHSIPDRDGEEFPNDTAAREYAIAVARDLMRNGPLRARSWRLEISDENLLPCFELLFASIDDSLSHLPVHLRNSIEHACHNTALLNDTIIDVQKTLLQVRETLVGANRIIDRVSSGGGQL
jgi:hypothetical protein